jgi:hypothetical protein
VAAEVNPAADKAGTRVAAVNQAAGRVIKVVARKVVAVVAARKAAVAVAAAIANR